MPTFIRLDASIGDIDTTDQLMLCPAYGKVFVVNGQNRKVMDFTNTKLTTTDLGANPPDRGNILTGGTSSAQLSVDYITTLSGACTLYGFRLTHASFTSGETVTGEDDDGNAISFTLSANSVTPVWGSVPPHWYNWTVYGGDTTNYGTMPDRAYLVALSGGRLVLSGNPAAAHQCPTSAAANPWDWNIYRTTADRACLIGTGPSGTIGDTVRTLIPARDGQLIIGCANSTHILIGNPAYGGQMVDINGIGIFGPKSWCFDANGMFYFWGTGGIYRIAKDASQVECLTAVSLPDLVADTGANPTTHRIEMGYDTVRLGIKITVTLIADGTSTNYWMDLKTEGVFLDTHSILHGVYSQLYLDAHNPTLKGLLFGCADGYIRVHDDEATDDDGVAISSHVMFGPLPLAEDGRDGSVEAFDLILAGGASGSLADSGNATLQVWAEDTAEGVVESVSAGTNPKLVMTFAGPGRARGAKRRRGVRGAYAGIKISGTSWGMEKLILDGGAPGRRLR
jgi:hypothetical protein